jgi:hypothetical protein
MAATETHEQYVARLKRAQAELLAKLQRDASDRPPHAHYLESLLTAPVDKLDDVLRPDGVGMRIAESMRTDVAWLREPAPEPGWLIGQYPNAYATRRAITAQAVAKQLASRQARREGTAPSLMELLKLKNP